MIELTEIERAKMKHALGLGVSERAYRNRYFTPPDSADGKIWEGLVARGLAFKVQSGDPYAGGNVHYWISKAGLDAYGLDDRSMLEGYELGEVAP